MQKLFSLTPIDGFLKKRAAVFLAIIILIYPATAFPAQIATPPAMVEESAMALSQKTLERRYDVVVVTGDLLHDLTGKEISHLRLYSFTDGTLQPIPYQIDERDPKGEFIFTGGDLAGEDVDKGRFDVNDELIFICSHAGDRVPKNLWPQESAHGHEIQVSDPRNMTQKGWVYLFDFPESPPAPSSEDYLVYDPEKDRVEGKYYTVGYEKGYTLYTHLHYPKEYGGSGEDFIDRLKIRLDVELLNGLIHVRRKESDILCKIVGWKDGPIRVLRNTENSFRILFKIPTPSIFSVTEYYPHYFSVPMRFHVPFNLKWVMNKFVVSGFAMYAYADFKNSMAGASGFTNRNLKGDSLTGHTTAEEIQKKFDLTNLGYGYFAKEGVGNWFCRISFPDAFLQYFHLYLKDDLDAENPPEEDPGEIAGGAFAYSKSLQKSHGVPGGKGFTSEEWDAIRSGTFELSMDTYMAHPKMKKDEVSEWLAIRDHPLWVDVKSNGKKPELILGEKDPALTKAVIFDCKGRQIHLRDLFFHIGSARTTAWDYVLGYEIDEEKWYTVPIDQIKQMNFRIEEIDPITGLPSPLFITITKKDGSTLDLFNAKSASFSGQIAENKTISIWNPWIKRIELRD